MPNYQNSKIYKITGGGLTYYGSTTQPLSKRLVQHKTEKKRVNHKYCTSFQILDFEDCDICLVEYYPCNSKEELHKRERHYIENNECINKIIPSRTTKEYYQEYKNKIKEQQKEYYRLNKDKISEQQTNYCETNKNKISEQKKEYRRLNKDKISEQKKEYYRLNKDKILEQTKEYHQENKDKISEQKKEYRRLNKDKIKEYKKEYYRLNKDKISKQQKEYYIQKNLINNNGYYDE
jgi:hypothetical protein